jgi:DNA-binding transcriptional ArsR family regulator
MDVDESDAAVSAIAAAIGEPARTRMLYSLLDGRACTATELAAVADVMPSTASAHLRCLEKARLLRLLVQGRHRYYSLEGANVAAALEALNVLAGGASGFVATTPMNLRAARTCYDHLAGMLGVRLHDRLMDLKWIRASGERVYDLTPAGVAGLERAGVNVDAARKLRRRFAVACLDWSERTCHLAGALGAALLALALNRKWIVRDLETRSVTVTAKGRRELKAWIGLEESQAG